MRTIPKKFRKKIAADPRMKACIYTREDAPNHDCDGRIEWEHAIMVSGRQCVEPWATVPCCTAHNHEGVMVKEYNRFRALEQATDEDIKKTFPKTYQMVMQEKKYLTKKYAQPTGKDVCAQS